MSKTLTPEELRWALEHAAQVHQLAEAQRDAAARCTSLAELRGALLESGIPAADVDTALASLELALKDRRRARGARRRFGLALAAGFSLAVVAGYLTFGGAAGKPLVFINLRHQLPGRAAASSWENGSALQGQAENALVTALTSQGIPVVIRLEEKNVRRLFVGAATQPTVVALRAATDASAVLLGDSQCAQVEGEAVDGPKTVRSTLRVEMLNVASGQVLFRDAAEATAIDANLVLACTQATTAAAREMGERLARQAAALLGSRTRD